MKKQTSLKAKLKALNTLGVGVGRYDSIPCNHYDPECNNCQLYVLEGLLEKYYKLLLKIK